MRFLANLKKKATSNNKENRGDQKTNLLTLERNTRSNWGELSADVHEVIAGYVFPEANEALKNADPVTLFSRWREMIKKPVEKSAQIAKLNIVCA